MGHACEILTFDVSCSKADIQTECDEWGEYNCDIQERGGSGQGLGFSIRWTDKIFDTREEAFEYLEGTFGDYRETAVKYKIPKKRATRTKAMEDLDRRISEYRQRINLLHEPHYKGVTVKTIKCKDCGAVLPTAYCGKSYNNNCPVCRNDLRPASILEKINKYSKTLSELEKQLKQETLKREKEASSKGYNLCWAVACEVHC